MPNVIKIAHAGINALTNTDPSKFSLYVDGTINHILVKEFSRGSQIVLSGNALEVIHNLGYPPMAIVNFQIASLDWQVAYGFGLYNPWSVWATTTKLRMINGDVAARTVAYVLFYDQL